MTFRAFPHIGQLRHLCKTLNHDEALHPTEVMTYRGTVKLHGTNAAVLQSAPGESIMMQSRNRLIDKSCDNFGFAVFVEQRAEVFMKIFQKIRDTTEAEGSIHLFGEFAGQGVQKNVAVSMVPKFYCIFAVALDGSYQDLQRFGSLGQPLHRIHDVLDFGTWSLELHRGQPEQSLAEVEAITSQVASICPVGSYFGIEGPGEGVVWQCLTALSETSLWFKSKGEDFVVSPAKLTTLTGSSKSDAETFAKAVMTKQRLKQAKNECTELGIDASTWAVQDVLREEADFIKCSDAEMLQDVLIKEAEKFL